MTVIITKTDGTKNRIWAAKNYKGFVTHVERIGIGEPYEIETDYEGFEYPRYKKYEDVYVPYFSADMLTADGLMEYARDNLAKKDINSIIGTEYEKYLLKFGVNEGGSVVEFEKDIKERETRAEIEALGFEFKCVSKSKKRIDVDDEDGEERHEYEIKSLRSGKVYMFSDRNIFDFGRVINPKYAIAEGVDGGLAYNDADGNLSWHTTDTGRGWHFVRKMEKEEEEAYRIAEKYGHTYKGIRM
jgi:hypothetical protein